MDTIQKNTQFNFRTNDELLAQAKKIVNDENYDLATVLNATLQTIVARQNVPIELVAQKAKRREKIIGELLAEIDVGRQDAMAGRKTPLRDVMAEYGV